MADQDVFQDAVARVERILENVFFRSQKLSSLVMPWCTYTDPEIAHVGMYVQDAAAAGIEVDSYHVPLHDVNRAVADGEDEGFVKVHVKKGTDKIVGGTIVAAHAGEMISELTLAIVNKIGLGALGNVIHPYPTQAEGLKRAAGLYTRTRLKPGLKKWFERWMAFRR